MQKYHRSYDGMEKNPYGEWYSAKEADARIGEIIAALRKFGIHSQGDGMERIGACKALRLAPPDFKEHGECTCGLSRFLAD